MVKRWYWGSNDALVISILTHRNEKQRKLIQNEYNDKYNVDIFATGDKKLIYEPEDKVIRYEVRSDLSNFELAVLLWTFERAERDVFLVRKAIADSNFLLLIEIYCTRSSLDLISLVYFHCFLCFDRKEYPSDGLHFTIESGMLKDPEFKKQLAYPLMTLYRYEGRQVDEMLAESEANLLHEKILEKAYTHPKVIEILTSGSRTQLRATLNHYESKFGNSINKDLKADPNDPDLKLLRVCTKCQMYPERHFAKALRLAINKPEVDEFTLTNIITSRAEIDMQLIKKEYHRKYGAHLDRDIAEHTSGSYREILLALLGVGNAEELS
ncbi:Annexin repeat [Dillenia turbinata]|uniref:Annexin repeat n=1 Tax=Dillenia turbinata TaxID=194707 RepID=A0AAN8VB22_9MAGN